MKKGITMWWMLWRSKVTAPKGRMTGFSLYLTSRSGNKTNRAMSFRRMVWPCSEDAVSRLTY